MRQALCPGGHSEGRSQVDAALVRRSPHIGIDLVHACECLFEQGVASVTRVAEKHGFMSIVRLQCLIECAARAWPYFAVDGEVVVALKGLDRLTCTALKCAVAVDRLAVNVLVAQLREAGLQRSHCVTVATRLPRFVDMRRAGSLRAALRARGRVVV